MKIRFRLIRRGVRGCRYYCVDTLTAKRTSLKTRSEDDALQIVQAKNQALRQPSRNLHIANAYLAGSDSGITTRTWQDALQAITTPSTGTPRSVGKVPRTRNHSISSGARSLLKLPASCSWKS